MQLTPHPCQLHLTLSICTSSDAYTVADYMVYMEKESLIRLLNFAPDGMDLVQKK